jgi:MFS family permease
VTPRPASTAALVLFIAFACNMIGRGIADSFMVFVLPLSEEFGWTRARVSSVYSAFLVVTGLAAPLTGLMIDRWGPRVVYPLGMLLLASASLVSANLSMLWQFQLCIGLLAGLGVSMLGMVPASILISGWFRDRMSTAMGVAYAGFGTGTIVMVPLAQRSIELQGWRDTYTTMGVATLAILPLLLLLPWRRIAGDRPVRAKTDPLPSTTREALLRALRTRAYWQIVQVFSFTSITTFSVITQVVPFLVQSGLSPLAAASAFGTAGLLSIFGILISGMDGGPFRLPQGRDGIVREHVPRHREPPRLLLDAGAVAGGRVRDLLRLGHGGARPDRLEPGRAAFRRPQLRHHLRNDVRVHVGVGGPGRLHRRLALRRDGRIPRGPVLLDDHDPRRGIAFLDAAPHHGSAAGQGARVAQAQNSSPSNGRTSHSTFHSSPWVARKRSVSSIACCSDLASMTAKPPITSLVSVNGPSVTESFPWFERTRTPSWWGAAPPSSRGCPRGSSRR